MRCSYVDDRGLQCPNKTKVKNARCWKDWGLCGFHAALLYPEHYPKGKGHKTGGRFGNKTNTVISMITTKINGKR